MKLMSDHNIMIISSMKIFKSFIFLFLCLSFRALETNRICNYDEMNIGQWIYRNDSNLTKSFRCCGGDGNDWQDPSLAGYCFANETLIASGRACYCDELLKTRHSVSEREKYFWKTDNCTTLDWNATYFCELLGQRKILILGDSTCRQTASTLRSMIQNDNPKGKCGMQILNRDSDYLVPINDINPKPLVHERSGVFYEHIHQVQPDIVVLATGAHYLNIDSYKSMLYNLAKKIEAIRRHYKNPPKFIWKTQNPGHHACKTGPNEKPYKNISEIVVYDDKNKWNYHRIYDQLAINMSNSIDMKVIDMSPLYLRVDGHVGYLAWDLRGGDCLHYCMPGPLNIFSVLMMHLLRNLDPSGNDDDFSV